MIEIVIPVSQMIVGEADSLPSKSLCDIPEEMNFISQSFWSAAA